MPNNRIVGGEEVEPNSIPFQVNRFPMFNQVVKCVGLQRVRGKSSGYFDNT